jgi:hypothetical protein
VEVTNGDTYATITAASGSKISWISTYGDAGTTVITRAGGIIGLLFFTNKDLYYIKTTVFFILQHGKEHQIFGIRAIIEAIQAGTTVDKVYIQKMRVAN